MESSQNPDLVANSDPQKTPKGSPLIMPRGLTIPHAEGIEQAILGGLMIDQTALYEALELISVKAFYHPRHQIIFQAIEKLWIQQNPVHLQSVALTLKASRQMEAIGGEVYLGKLSTQFASSAHVVYHCSILLQMQMRRELIQLASKINNEVYNEEQEIFDLLEKIEKSLYEIGDSIKRKEVKSADELLKVCLERIKKAQDKSNETGMTGLATGFTELDRITAGFQDSDLIIVAARPGMGKTAFALSILRNISVIKKVSAAFFSLEMSSDQVMTRILSMETQIPQSKIKSGLMTKVDWDKIDQQTDDLKKAPLYIDDTPGLSIFEFRSKARKIVAKLDVKLIVIDYLQLMRDHSNTNKNYGNREQEIASISRNLKAIAKELSIPIVALAQLSRAVEARPDKRPMTSDLRESGSIEQDADIVSFIFRPDRYNILEWEDGSTSEGQAELMIAKHRNGETGNVRVKFSASYAQFENLGANPPNLKSSALNNNASDDASKDEFPKKLKDDKF